MEFNWSIMNLTCAWSGDYPWSIIFLVQAGDGNKMCMCIHWHAMNLPDILHQPFFIWFVSVFIIFSSENNCFLVTWFFQANELSELIAKNWWNCLYLLWKLCPIHLFIKSFPCNSSPICDFFSFNWGGWFKPWAT